jgi:hypothetical protein
MHRRTRIAGSTAAVGALVAGAAAALAAVPDQHHHVTAAAVTRLQAPVAKDTDAAQLASIRAEAAAAKRRVDALNRAVARTAARIKAAQAKRASLAAARSVAAAAAATAAAASQATTANNPTDFTPSAPSQSISVSHAPPAVHTTTGASGAAPGSGEPGDDGPGDPSSSGAPEPGDD